MSANSHLTWDEVCRRAGGRRRYNKLQQDRVWERLTKVEDLRLTYGTGYGIQSRIACELGVSCSTICRDFQLLAAGERGDLFPDRRRPSCGMTYGRGSTRRRGAA